MEIDAIRYYDRAEKSRGRAVIAIAYWLLPSERTRDFFFRTIHQLSARYAAAAFEPHLTLLVDPESASKPEEVLRHLGAVHITLPVCGIGHSAEFTKTLFVQFQRTQILQQIARRAAAISIRGEAALDPHLSLLYQVLPELTREGLAREIVLPFAEVSFDAICAVRCPSPTENAGQVRAWEMIVASGRSGTRGLRKALKRSP